MLTLRTIDVYKRQAQRMKEVAKVITDGEQKIVVLSAMSGTTNTLVEISDYLYKKNPEGANAVSYTHLDVYKRQMQVISEQMINAYPNKIINIHHSFLPAFVGAKMCIRDRYYIFMPLLFFF